MLRLNVRPFWREILPGVHVQFRQPTPAERGAAHRAVARARDKATAQGLDEAEIKDLAGIAFTIALAAPCIVAWKGVVDHDDREIEPTPEAISSLLSNWDAFQGVDREFIFPQLDRNHEKNGSGGSSDGISAAPIPGKATAAAVRPAAKNAPTGSTTRKATKAKRSGK
jgi:hypothetical protein